MLPKNYYICEKGFTHLFPWQPELFIELSNDQTNYGQIPEIDRKEVSGAQKSSFQGVSFDEIIDDQKLICCGSCKYTTTREFLFKKHLRETHPSNVIQCKTCDYQTKWHRNMKDHERKHTKDFFKCSQCSFKTHAQSYLRQHTEIVHSDNYFSCTECSYRTKWRKNLTDHSRKHTNCFFNCNLCTFKTLKKGNLVRHEKTMHQ